MSISLYQAIISAASLAMVGVGKKVNFGVMTDIHLSTKYKEDIAAIPSHCEEEAGAIRSEDIANFGRIGCDPPFLLAETMVKIMATEYPNLDVVLLPGDFTGHGVAMDPKKTYDSKTE